MHSRLSSLAVTFLVCLSAAGVSAQTVEELVAKNLEAKGGVARLNAVTTVRMTGRVTAQGMEAPLTITMKRPNMVIQEMTVQGQRLVQAFDGERAWVVNPMMGSGPREVQGVQVELMKDQTEFAGVLADYQSKGHTVELVGPETVQGRKAYRLKVTRKSGQVQLIDLDADTGLEIRTTTEMTQQGMTVRIESVLSNYRAASGIVLPHTMQSLVNGQPMSQVTFERVDFDLPIDDARFRMPK
jgi:outer membrane lipoprotein-sorting protein